VRSDRSRRGRNGWYCSENEVEKWWDLAGWRGLQQRSVFEHFGGIFYAFGERNDPTWGPNEKMIKNLNLNYSVTFMGDEAETVLYTRLSSNLSTLFYLWTPHPFLAKFQLNRIALPAFKNAALFSGGKTDFPTDTLEKVASKTLNELAPQVYQMYSRFSLENSDQVEMLDETDKLGSTMMAACAWLTSPDHEEFWKEAWIPKEEFLCPAGQYMIDGVRCEPCPQGQQAAGGKVTSCKSCSPGMRGARKLQPPGVSSRGGSGVRLSHAVCTTTGCTSRFVWQASSKRKRGSPSVSGMAILCRNSACNSASLVPFHLLPHVPLCSHAASVSICHSAAIPSATCTRSLRLKQLV
jgi:hypothetical protein